MKRFAFLLILALVACDDETCHFQRDTQQYNHVFELCIAKQPDRINDCSRIAREASEQRVCVKNEPHHDHSPLAK